MKLGFYLFLFTLMCRFQAFSASQGRSLFSPQEKDQLEKLKSDEALIQRYHNALQRSAKRRPGGFLKSMSQQEKTALMGEWRDPQKYWKRVDQGMTKYYFQKWLRRELDNLEQEE